MFRYLKVLKRKIVLFIIIIALVIASSVTKGRTAIITATLAGVAMIYAGITFLIYIIRTPTKRDMNDGV